MTATARFLHQLRHDFMASRVVLAVVWALLTLSVPGLWLDWSARGVLGDFEYSSLLRETDLLSGWAALFSTASLAFLLAKITPHDTEAFYHSRPVRSGLLILSATTLFLTCVLLPVFMQQAALCQMAVGSVPWSDVLLRLLSGTLPYAVCLAFAFIIGTSPWQRSVLLLATLVLLYYTRFSGIHQQTDDIFAALPWNVKQYFNEPFSIGYYSWPSSLPHPSLRLANDLMLLAIGLAVCVAAWRWRWRLAPAVIFLVGVVYSHGRFTNEAGQSLRWLTAGQEKAMRLDRAAVTASQVHLLSTGPPAGGFELKLLPIVRDVPPPYTATLGLMNSALRSPGNWEIGGPGTGFLYMGPSQNTSLNRHMRLAPEFAGALLGSPVVSLSPKDRDSMDNPENDRDLQPANVDVFMHEDAVSLDKARGRPQTALWLQPVMADSDVVLPLSQCRVLARLPLHAGVHWQEGSQDLRISRVTPTFKTIRTPTGTGTQWSGCDVAFWYSFLVFDHHDDRQRTDHTLDGNLIPLLYNPVRHELLGDMKALSAGRFFAGTPVSMTQRTLDFKLEESRIGSLDEHWLDEAEMVFIESRFVGTLKRHLVLEGLQPTKDQEPE